MNRRLRISALAALLAVLCTATACSAGVSGHGDRGGGAGTSCHRSVGRRWRLRPDRSQSGPRLGRGGRRGGRRPRTTRIGWCRGTQSSRSRTGQRSTPAGDGAGSGGRTVHHPVRSRDRGRHPDRPTRHRTRGRPGAGSIPAADSGRSHERLATGSRGSAVRRRLRGGGPDGLFRTQLARTVGVDPRASEYRVFDGGGELLPALLTGEVDVATTGVSEYLTRSHPARSGRSPSRAPNVSTASTRPLCGSRSRPRLRQLARHPRPAGTATGARRPPDRRRHSTGRVAALAGDPGAERVAGRAAHRRRLRVVPPRAGRPGPLDHRSTHRRLTPHTSVLRHTCARSLPRHTLH